MTVMEVGQVMTFSVGEDEDDLTAVQSGSPCSTALPRPPLLSLEHGMTEEDWVFLLQDWGRYRLYI